MSTEQTCQVTNCVLVTGDTFKVKGELKELGGTWVKSLSGWVLPEDKRPAVLAALGGGAVTEGPLIAKAVPTVEPSVASNASLVFGKHKRALLVTGDTKAVKEQIQGMGGKWNKALVGWIFKPDMEDDLRALLVRDPTCTITGSAGQSAAGSASKSAVKDEKPEDEKPAVSGSASKSATGKSAANQGAGGGDDNDDDDAPLTKRAGKEKSSKKPEGEKPKEVKSEGDTASSSAPAAAPLPSKGRASKRRPWNDADGMVDLERKGRAYVSGEYKRLKQLDPHSSDSDSDDYGPLMSGLAPC